MRLKSARLLRKQLTELAGLEQAEPGYVVLEKAKERRVTTGVMYIPDRVDAHGEFAKAEDLEEAVHDYMLGGDLKIRKQHDTSVVIGDVVGMISWPFEHSAVLKHHANGVEKSNSIILPAGTIYTTVKWTPEAWPEVKAGRIGGLSMGGTAVRIRG